MKKILLFASISLGSLLTVGAQTTVWSEDFNDDNIDRTMLEGAGWTFIDSDGDGFNWGDMFNITDSGGTPIFSTPAIVSRSW